MTTLKPGDKVAERYVIVEPIGEGGMGVVYSARDEKLRRTVALKMLSPARVGSKTARSRMKREARAAAALDNPGIAQVFDVDETDDGGVYLVMELVRGKSVRALKAAVIERAEALRIVGDVARTLGAAHRADLVHRDVKPDNIMVRDDGRVVLLDFGIAKDLSTGPRKSSDEGDDSVVTGKGALLGTPPYVAPEQIRGKDVGPASDQFALAVVAFGLLTGKKPWDAPTELGLLGQILMEPAMAATAVAPSLPKAVDAVFERALAKEAPKRFPSIEVFAEALEAAVTGKEAPAAEPKAAAAEPKAAVPRAAEKTPAEETPAPAEKTPAPAEKTPAEKTPAPAEKTPAPAEKTPAPSGDALEASLDDDEPAEPAPAAPATYAPPVWKVRVDHEPPPPRSTGRLVVAAILIAVVAAAAGVWYGRNNAPPPSTTGSPAPRHP